MGRLVTKEKHSYKAGDSVNQSLAVKYRPKTFEELYGQTSTVKILTRQIELNKFKNCYLFCGASGCGKTTAARIFAKMINNNIGDPIEVDGASNNGVENVKQIIKQASERSLDGKYKIYVIDECHMLTIQAWNAFLKCIEEPPAFTIFIFCTTDPQKIPSTILNRVQRFNFNRLSSSEIKSRLLYICNQEGFTNFEDSCDYISRISNGQMRDAIATLEKCADYSNNLTLKNTLDILGSLSYELLFELVNSILDGKEKEVINIVNTIYNSGGEMKLFINQFLSFILDIQKFIICQDISITKLPSNFIEDLKRCINFDSPNNFYSYLTSKILKLKNMIKDDVDPKVTIEVELLAACRLQ